MKLIFVGLMYNPFDKELIKTKTINGFQESADTFQWSFINGLISDTESRTAQVSKTLN